tara:strand:+ start:239 stop:409 length:171 start_codon:yes stop_codon:yes gene_type:complete
MEKDSEGRCAEEIAVHEPLVQALPPTSEEARRARAGPFSNESIYRVEKGGPHTKYS